MKIHANTGVVERSEGAESAFTIKATAKAFSILSSGLYSDKILAIVRELSCNAFDAHAAAGRTNVPFEVKLPTRLDPTFYVKDFGLGLSTEDVVNLYTTYFDSTKADSNEYIGALGLGSKSPFSYTQMFTVESRFNGTKTVFSAFLNEHGLPTIKEMDRSSTDEHNGLTVSFAVNNEDIETFKTKAMRALMYFNPQPVVKGWADYRQLQVKTLFAGNNWQLVSRESGSYYDKINGPMVKQGPVIYPINAEILKRSGALSKAVERLLSLNIDLEVQMGEVDVAASREALSYDKRTVANLIKRFETISKEFEQQLVDSLATATSLWEARNKLATYNTAPDLKAVIRDMISAGSFNLTWKGQKVETKFGVNLQPILVKHQCAVQLLMRRNYQKRNNVTFTSANGPAMQIDTADVQGVVVADIGRLGSNDVIGQWLSQQDIAGKKNEVVVVFAESKKDFTAAEAAAKLIAQEMGGAEVFYASKLPFKPSKKSYTYKPRSKTEVWQWSGFQKGGYRKRDLNTTYSKLTWNTVEVDFSEGGFYIEVDRFTPLCDGNPVDRLDMVIDMTRELGINESFYALNKKQIETAKEEGEWVELFSHIKSEIARLKLKPELERAGAGHRAAMNINSYLLTTLSKWKKRVVSEPDSLFKETVLVLANAIESKWDGNKIDTIRFGLAKIGITLDFDRAAQDLISDWKKMVKKYPMLQYFNFGGVSSSDIDTVIEYVSQVGV